MTGIPDPGGVSGTFAALDRTQPTGSPFEFIRQLTPEGREFWSARDLMPMLGYEKWERFADAIHRAAASAMNAGHDRSAHFPASGKKVGIGSGAERMVSNYHLSRLACYLVAMNGDPRKPEVAAAQTYFAVRTREAEISRVAAPAIPQTYAEALRAAADQADRAELAEARVAELEPPAAAWTELAEAAGDYSVADAAKVLSRDPAISTGERRLFQSMAAWQWIYRPHGGRWRAYQDQVDNGRLVEKINRPYVNSAGETVAPAPTIRITPKGIEALQKNLGGGGQQLALAVAE